MRIKLMQLLYSFSLVIITLLLAKSITYIGISEFYNNLNLPSITPQNHFFAKIWRFIYALLIWSFFLVLKSNKDTALKRESNFLFINQLFLQVLWCFSFFYLEQIYTSLIVMFALNLAVILMMYSFYKINIWAFVFTIPYIAWLIFATILNILIVFLN